MRVRSIYTPAMQLTILLPKDTAQKAFELFETKGFLSLPVVDGKKFVGFVSKQFVYDAFFEEDGKDIKTFLQKPVMHFIREKVETVTEDIFIEEAAHIFFKENIRFIPVVSDHDEFLGIITQRAIFNMLTKVYGLEDPKIVIVSDDFKGTLAKITEIIYKNDGNITNIAHVDTAVMGLMEISIRVISNNVERIVEKLEEKGFSVKEFVK